MVHRSTSCFGLIISLLFTVVLSPKALITAEAAANISTSNNPVSNQIVLPDKPDRELADVANTTSAFNVSYVPDNGDLYTGGGIPCKTFPESYKPAVTRAVNTWSQIVSSPYKGTIMVQLCWREIAVPDYLISSTVSHYYKNFPGAPARDLYYPAALANILSGSDRDGSSAIPEITIAINGWRGFNFWYGGDGITPSDKYNLYTAILRQLAIGMGFSSTFSFDSSSAAGGNSGLNPCISYDVFGCTATSPDHHLTPFDLFVVDSSGQPLTNTTLYPKGAALGQILTNGPIYFNSPNVLLKNKNSGVRLAALTGDPSDTSLRYLDDTIFDRSPNALMTRSLSKGETIYEPGSLTIAILADLGWPMAVIEAAPSDLLLSKNRVKENLPGGSLVGSFTPIDPNPVNTFTYALVDGTGSQHNSSFFISGSDLLTREPMNYEAQSQYSIRVRTTDSTAFSYEKAFTILIENVNEAPTAISLSSASIAENRPAGTLIGTLSTADPDAGDSHTYSLLPNCCDNALFRIDGNRLVTQAPLDFETRPALKIQIQSKDWGSAAITRQFTIHVTDVNEIATRINLQPRWIRPATPAGSGIGVLSANDPDVNDTLTFTLPAGVADNDLFRIEGNQLKLSADAQRPLGETYTIRVDFWDASGSPANPQVTQFFTLTISTVTYLPVVFR